MKDFLKKVLILFTVLLMSMPSSVLNLGTSVVRADDPLNIETRRIDEHTTITQNGCYRKIEKTDATDWTVPRKPIDLVILQDASGSFRTTIPSVKRALKRLTTYVSPEQYDENDPHLVKTDDPRTTDRVFVASYQGLDQVRYFENNDFSGNPANVYTDANSTGKNYTYGNSGLTSDQNKVHSFIDNIAVDGGTPTVPAIDDTIAQYNRVKGNMENGRKTVFLLVTDGVANGYRLPGTNTVVMDKSWTRTDAIQKAWGVDSYPEAAQDITGRANELKAAGNQLKAAVGSEGSVVVGFWERVDNFTEKYYQYGPAYLNGFGNTINIGDNRSVQAIFHDALQSMASPDKVVNGKNVSFYVNEQNNIDVFSQKILESVAAALVKDDITGEFDITEGYKVDAIRINGKKIVPKVTDPSKEIRGTITQTGNKVKISVPDSVFNPGKNSFDYDLSKEARAPETDEDSEVDPPENYVPEKEEITVPELTGKFKAGDFETRQIGGRNQTVEVQKLEYCYPSATKTVKDADASNDIGVIPDPLELTKKPSYSAQLSKKDEEFTYTVDYNFNNVPYEFEKNVMLTDPIDYRLEVVSHSAQGPDGQSWPTRVVTQQDAGGNSQSVVVADVPSQGKDYNYLIMKKAKLKMTVRLKEEYRKNQASKAYLAILQNNNGYGLVNQGNIMWNGEDDSPNQDAHAKTKDKASTIRRSNPIYVKPPLDTEVDKKVNEKEHEGLQADGEEFEYKVTAPWPGIADKFTLTDTVVDELEIVPNSAKVTVAGKSYNALTKAIAINGQTIEITLDKTQLTSLNRLISRRGGSEVQEIELIFKAKIRPGADLSKYKKNGAVNIPNTADVILNDKKKTSKEVTVTPPKPKEPTVSKKINNTLDSLVTFDGQPYTYNITTAVPSDVAGYKKFVISDKLDADLEFDGQASISGPLADVFEIQTNGQTVTATVKEGKFKELAKYSFVELTIPAKVKAGVTGKTIENKAKISFTNENNVAKEVESNPVTVTPPPVTKKINENLDHLDIATGQPYKYNVKTTLPSDITSYKEFVITDTLEDELSVINEGADKPVISGPAADFFDVTVSGQKVTATMKNFAGASALAGQEIELVIPAKINDGVTRSNIPNKATFSFKDKNDHKGEKETIPVTVTPPTEPNVSKKINGDQDNATIAAETDFTYNIKTTLPNDIDTYKSFVITDTLDENLGVVNPEPSISEEAKKFFDITVSGNTVTATMKDFAKASALANKEIELVIHAKVKKESVLPEIPNTAKITYTNKNNESKEKETEPVKVTPPPITKKVNGKDQEDLASLTSTFKYTVDSKVPTVADKFVLSDTLEEVLTFDGDATVTIDGQAVTDVTVAKKGQKLTVTFDKDQVKKYAGKAVQVAFDAKIKSGYTVDQLVAKYPNGDKAAIPNKASFVVNDNPETEKFSNPVTVTPPPPNTPEIEKKVNGADSYNLQTRLEEFTYSLNTAMPTNATEFTVTDELKSVLEFAGNKGDVQVKIDGKAANDQATISTDKNTLTVAFAEKAVKANAGKSIEVTFKAKIREGANLLDYLVPGQGIRIPNKASYDIDHNPKFHKDSNEVPVTPPSPEQPPIEKDVNDKAEATLEARDEEFTYHVKTKIPYEATAFNITDTLKDVLDFSGEKGQAEATVDGKKLSDDHIAINGQTITVTLNQEELKANADKEIKLTFKAKIRPNANLAAYVVGDKVVINNQASYNVDLPDNPGVHKDSNIVPVTPPSPEKPEIEKTVNDAKEATLANRDEIFTYKVKTKVPFDATAFSIDDTIKDVLEFADAGSATLNGEALEADRISIADQKITLTLTEDQVKNNGGKEVVLTFKAKIRQGANLSGYIEKGKTVINNQASYNAAFPNDPNFHKDSNIVPVTPPNPENPPIEKKVNEAESANLGARDEEFTYTIDTTVPLDVTGFAVYDTIEKVLEFSGENGQASATVDGQPLDASHITIKGQKITVKLTEDEAKALGGKAVHVSFKAKIKAGANLSDYIEKDGTTRIYNTAKYNFNNDPGTEQSSKPVPVIPPTPTEPELKKEVNGKEAETLANRDDVFTYTVKTTVPQDATAFSISDSLVPVLEFAGEDAEASLTLNGEKLDAKQIKLKDQTISAELTEAQVKANGGKEVVLNFKAKIREGANLADYIEADGVTRVPNKASYVANFPHRPKVEKDSNIVPVTPPSPENPPVEKKVNNKPSATLDSRDEEFTYTIDTKVPVDATGFKITDELKDVLEFSGKKGQAEVTVDGDKDVIEDSQITVDKQVLTVTLTKDQVKKYGNKAVHVSFKAKIRKNVSLAGYIEADGVTRIPNIAKYIINDDPKTEKSTEPVPVIPPSPEEPGIKKEVNGQPEATLKERYEEFTYKVTTSVPQDATAFSVSDTLVPVLEFSGEKGQATATLDGQEIDANRINVADQTISMALTEDEVKANGGKEVTLTFKAKIREGANLSAYIEKGKTSIPNTASYTAGFPNRPEIHKDSNRVPVTPPTPEEPEIKKDINGKEEETLANRNDEFTYHINTKVPFDATAFSINDELKDVLEFADGTGRATASLNGQALDADRISINGQTITVNLTEEQVKNNGGKDVNLTFTAKIRQGVNLSGYIKDGKTSIPNKASYRVDFPNNPGVTKDSNEVPVTPPSPENPPIEKKVNEAESANLGARDEEFTYTIDTTVPLDVTGFAVYDTIEKVLEFSGENGQASATVDGQPLDASHITIKGQKITVKLTEDEAKALGGKAVHVSFKAKIKAGANLSDYIEKDGTTRIYNTAKYNFNNDPGTEQSSKPVPVIPPTPTEPELKKEVNGKEAETLANRDDVFTYTVKTTVPQDATAFSISDKLEDVLEFAGESSATLAGEDLKADQITTDGQTIKLTLTEDQVKANGGKEVVLNFKAKIREGANLSAYMKADKAEVPNKASYTVGFPNKPAVTKDSNVVPVTPPSPEQPPIEKDVNSKPSETIADRTEEFTYNIHTTMPQDATGFTVTDELKDVLEFAGDVQVTLGGKKADAAVAKNGQTLEVTFPEETVKANGGKKVQVTFKAKIKADADLTPYETANSYSVPNTASYLINNNPASKKETKPVTVEVPKQPGPEVTKKINRTLDHLDVDRDVPYMYNVNTQIPKDIRLYKEFTVTDTLEPVLEITGTPVAYVDGYATDAVETKVEGNTVTVTVKDFARISGYKEIQLYIPAKLKADSDLSAYENQTVPNKATIAFKDSNGKNGTKESNPVTVRPRDPEKPEEPKPNEPAKTVGPADGSNPSTAYRLKELKEGFRFDVTAKVPTDPVDESGNPIKDAQGRDVKTELNSFTVTDELEKVLKVDRVAVKVEENKVAEAIAKITAKIEKAESDLKELEGKETNGTFAKKLAEAEKKVEELTAQLAAAKEKATAAATPATPAPSSDSDAGNATATPAPADNNAEVVALEESLKAAQAELEQLKADGAKAGNLATPEEQKVEQDKLNKNLEQLKESKEKLEKALEAFTTVNDKGEITDEALAKIAKVTVEGQKVTVEVTDKAVLEALKGSTFRVIIYSSIKDGADLSSYLNKENNETKIPNKATVTFNDKPKVTNTVNVYPPEPNTPPTTPHTPPTTPNTPPPTTPDTPPAPKGDLPPAPTPEPEKPKNILPKTGTSGTMVNEVIIGMILVLMGLLLRRKPKH